jgi:hypothetical protein
LGLVALAVAVLAPIGARADLAPLKVFEDPTLDCVTTAEATPPDQDLVAGYIAETDDSLLFTWQVADLNDAASSGTPELFIWHFEFAIDDPGVNPPALFSLRARAWTVEGVRGGGSLQGNCTNTGGVVQCVAVPGAGGTVAFDTTENTVTAKVRRQDLKGADGQSVAVAEAHLSEFVLFRGIVSCTTFVAVISSAMCDEADMDADYILGSPR